MKVFRDVFLAILHKAVDTPGVSFEDALVCACRGLDAFIKQVRESEALQAQPTMEDRFPETTAQYFFAKTKAKAETLKQQKGYDNF
jgi:hypothetical protein